MNRLNPARKTAAMVLLNEGHGVRAISRILGVHQNTVTSVAREIAGETDRVPVRGRPTLGEKAKTKILPIRVTEAEHQSLMTAAKDCKSLSSWIRRELFRAAKEKNGNH